MNMNMWQPLQCDLRKVDNVKSESYSGNSRFSVRIPARQDIRSSMKKVEITSMNRIYSGIGIRNDNGGLEFISDEYRQRHASSAEDILSDLRSKLSAMEAEMETVESETARGSRMIDGWQNEYADLQSQLQDVQDSMHHLILQGKKGQLSEEEKTRIRSQLKMENRRIRKKMTSLKVEIDGFRSNTSRLSYLTVALAELNVKIADREKALAIANTFTIDQPGILTFPRIKGFVAKSVCLFSDLFDYLAYVYMSNNPDARELPYFCDNIVMNDPRNFMTMMLNSDGYDHIYCFFPHTYMGKTMERTILERNDPRVVTMSDYYDGYTTLYEYAKTFDDFIPVQP